MSDNLGITRLPQGATTPEVMLNAAFSEIDALLSEAIEIDLSAGNINLSLETLKGGSFLSLNGAAEARTVLLPQTKRTLFLKNYGTAEVTVTRGTKSVAIPTGQARTVRLTGATDGLEDIGGGGSGGGSAGLPEAPTDGKFYARKSAAWAEVPAAGGSPGVAPKFAIWRLYGTIKTTTNQIGFDTFNINNAVDGTVTVAVSSTESSYPAGNAKPGVAGAWYSAPGSDPNPWIEYTFPAPIDGDSIYLYGSNLTYAPQSIRLEARNSTSDPWTVVIPTTPHTPTTPGGDASYGIPRVVEGGSGGGIEEAPTDGKQYARKDAGWTEVVATGGGSSGDPFAQYIPLFKIWRFTCTRTRDTNRFAIAELVMADIDGNSLNSRVIASSSKNADGTSVVANVLDGNNATVYMSAANASAADPQWIEFEFDTPVSVAEFRMKVQASWWERFPWQGWISGRNAAADPHNITTTYDIGRASPQQQETFFAFQTVKRILQVVGPYPIEPPTATNLPLEFKSGASVAATLVDNPRGFLLRRTDTGSTGSDTNYERMRNIDTTKDYILDCIIKPPPTNRSSYTRYGLALRESATDKHLYFYFATESNSPKIASLNASNIQGAGASFNNLKSYDYADCYFRIVKTSAGYQLQFSENYGITFTTLATYTLTQYFTAQADQVGLIAQAFGGFTAPMDLVCPYFKLIQA